MSKIELDHVALKFRIYHEAPQSAKELFANLVGRGRKSSYTDYWAVNDISLILHEGERVGVVGRNGAGKSTLLKTICRIYEPQRGRITVNGRIAPLLEIGAGFHPEFSGRENIYFNGTILGYSRAQIAAIEREVIAFAELEEFIDTPVKYYSTGMYMRLAFSLATTLQPDILILDEVFAGGDSGFVKRGKERMYKMIDRSSLMILVSHDPNLLRSLCNRFIWIEQGKVIDDGDASVLDRYEARITA